MHWVHPLSYLRLTLFSSHVDWSCFYSEIPAIKLLPTLGELMDNMKIMVETEKKILYLSPEGSDWREAWTAASSYGVGCVIGWLCGGVNKGTLFSSFGGNSTPADWKTAEQAKDKLCTKYQSWIKEILPKNIFWGKKYVFLILPKNICFPTYFLVQKSRNSIVQLIEKEMQPHFKGSNRQDIQKKKWWKFKILKKKNEHFSTLYFSD